MRQKDKILFIAKENIYYMKNKEVI